MTIESLVYQPLSTHVTHRAMALPEGDALAGAKPQTLEQAAEKFEAMFLREMLKEMRKSADVLAGDEGIFSSGESRTVRDFYDDALAQELASQRSTGIASLLIRQLNPQNTR